MVGPLLFLLQHALSRGAILQGKLTQDLAKAMNADLAHGVHWMAQEQQEGVKPGGLKRAGGKEQWSSNRVLNSPADIMMPSTPLSADLLIIRRCTVFRMMILSAQSLRKSDIFCFSAGFISCLAMTLR